MTRHTLEPAAQKIADATSKPPFPYKAGVRTTSVRFNGTLHDFLMLNPSAARLLPRLPSNRRSTSSASRPGTS
jgi:hypothetical protein